MILAVVLASTLTIKVPDDTFPPNVRVREGGTITWLNQDSDGHTVTSRLGASLKRDLVLAPGRHVSVTFPKLGHTYVWSYYCKVHPKMVGKVTVVHP